MALTVGTGPFGHDPAGRFNFTYDAPAHVLYFEDSPRRVRVVVAGETIAKSSRAKLLHETGLMRVYYLPEEDVQTKLLEPTGHTTRCPFKGDAAYWTIRVDDDERENAVWSYPAPLAGGLPPRFYLPEDDVDLRLLERTGTETACPYKGTTSRYYTVAAGGDRLEDVAWVYDAPTDEVAGIAGLIAFYNEKVDLEVDGETWERPRTKFS